MDSENPLNGQNPLNDFLSKCRYGLDLVDLLISLLTKPSWVSRLKVKVYKNKESFGTHLFASPILLTKFGLSVSSVWSPVLIKNLIIWSCDFQNKTEYSVSYILLDFGFAEEPETGREFKVELLYFDMLFINKFYI